MTMLLLVFRQSFGQELQQLLEKQDAKAVTKTLKVVGIGKFGTHVSLFAWPGHHSMIIVAMGEQQADEVVTRLRSGGQGMCTKNAGRHWVATRGEGKKSWFALH